MVGRRNSDANIRRDPSHVGPVDRIRRVTPLTRRRWKKDLLILVGTVVIGVMTFDPQPPTKPIPLTVFPNVALLRWRVFCDPMPATISWCGKYDM